MYPHIIVSRTPPHPPFKDHQRPSEHNWVESMQPKNFAKSKNTKEHTWKTFKDIIISDQKSGNDFPNIKHFNLICAEIVLLNFKIRKGKKG